MVYNAFSIFFFGKNLTNSPDTKKIRFQIQNFSTHKEGRLTSNLALKNDVTERKFEKYCEAKKMHKGHISGRRKKCQPEKNQKLKVLHSYREKK